ncbi:MAG: protein translocase subunit SecF [Acidimicrobiia bacterium]|nr:protein translocase subunit SecF [Acidimicrobiia bacterium]
MSVWRRLYQGETEFDFVGIARRRWFIVSGVLLVASVLSLGVRELNLSLDFLGGIAVDVPNPAGADLGDVRDALSELGLQDARIQLIDDGAELRVQTETVDNAVQDRLTQLVAEVAGVSIDETNVESVGPTFGADITRRAVEALVVFLIVVVIFISIRFEWKMAVSALAALAHDLLLTFGAYSIIGFEVTPATVVAILTILGYSLYDTVVVFDKINENVSEFGDQMTITDVVNRSMNEVLMRSINTSLTSLLPVGSLLFVGSVLLGAGTLREFALALFVGIGAGTYSSLYIASPLLALWKEREEQWERRRYRTEKKASDRSSRKDATAPAPAPVPPEQVSKAGSKRLSSQGQRSVAESRPPGGSGAVPRPPKKRRKN